METAKLFTTGGSRAVVAKLSALAPNDCVISTVTSFELFARGGRIANPKKARAEIGSLAGHRGNKMLAEQFPARQTHATMADSITSDPASPKAAPGAPKVKRSHPKIRRSRTIAKCGRLYSRSFFFRKASSVSLNSAGLSSMRKCETSSKVLNSACGASFRT